MYYSAKSHYLWSRQWRFALLVSLLLAGLALPQLASAARTFQSLTITPASTNLAAGAAVTANVALTTKPTSGSTAYGQVTNLVSISPAAPGVTLAINPNTYYMPETTGGETSNSTLTVTTSSSTPVNTYTVQVVAAAGPTNALLASITPYTNTFTMMVTSSAADAFSMSILPASANVFRGAATNVNATVTFIDSSATLSGTVTNGVTVSPSGQGVTAALNSIYAPITNNFGQTNLVLTLSAAANATPGTYQVVVSGTNGNFTANNPVAGVASFTNYFTIVSPPMPLAIQTFNLSGTTLTITGANGAPDAQYVVLASTNLVLPRAQWTPVATNTFDGNGNFNTSFDIASTVDPSSIQQFFVVLQTSNLLGAVATPVFSPIAAPYYAETPVTISSATPGATIRYTTDGSTPTETHGNIYSGPVTMQQAVYTNMALSFVTNASGVTMLKAVAYKSGPADSAVFTGNYIIIVPLRYAQTSSLVLGLAHMAYNVSSQNWNSVLSLWTSYLGYDTVVLSNNFALIKINDQQYIELYENPIVASQYQLANYGFYVSDAEAYRQQLAQAGVTVPASCIVNALGNLSFFTTDPDGHVNEWLQYLPGSVTSQSLGQHMPGTQLFGYMDDYGDATASVSAADSYYTQCGFSGTGTKVYLPNSNCYLEMLTYSTLTQAEAGKHEKSQLVTFRGMDVLAAANILQTRAPSIVQTRSTEGGSGFPMHNCVDVYSADLSRIRIIDINY